VLPPLTISGWLRYDLVERVLRGLDGVETILEVGAGMGAVGARLARGHRYVGVEPDPQSCEVAQRRVAKSGTGSVLSGGVSALPADFHADLVCAFEVLEHVEDDKGELLRWAELLRPGGALIISVPAWQRRFGPSDRKVGHLRRYDRSHLVSLLGEAGFVHVRLLTYGFPVGYLLQPAWNLLARRADPSTSVAERTSSSGRWIQPPLWLAWAWQLISLPFRLIQRPFVNSDLGTGFVAVAQRSDADQPAPSGSSTSRKGTLVR
jgi:SAM-dependent methyltransferase